MDLLVAPLAGARIEICHRIRWQCGSESLPSRERGLKSLYLIQKLTRSTVAPLAGARIEIRITIKEALDQAESLPSRERGLKF